jgi:hypothetical protein
MKSNKLILILFVWAVLLLTVNDALSQQNSFDEFVLSENGRQAYQVLSNVDLFAVGAIGERGGISKGEEALNTLIREKMAINALKFLVIKATPEGGLYALFGLKNLNCECFDEELRVFEKLPEPPKRKFDDFYEIPEGEVARVVGCKGFSSKRLDVAKKIKDGKVEVRN